MLKQKFLWVILLLCNGYLLQAQSEDGVGVLSNQTPSHTHYQIVPDQVRSIHIKKDNADIVQIPLKSRSQATGFELTYNSSVGIENQTGLPKTQKEFAQGQSSGGSLRWFGPETGEIFSWGPSLRTLEYDGSSYDYDRNGRLVPAGTGSGIPANAYGVEDFFRTGFLTSNNVKLLLPMIGENPYIEAKLGQSLKNSPVRNSNFQSYNAALSLKRIKYEDFEAELSGAYNYSKGHLLAAGANMASLIGSLLTTPPSFDNTNALAAKEAASQRYSWQLPNGNIRSFAPGNADNPYGFLNALPDQEEQNHWLTSALLNFRNKTNDGFSAQLKGDFQSISNDKTNGLPAGFSAYPAGRLSTYDINTSTGGFQFLPVYNCRYSYNDKFRFYGSFKFYGDYTLRYQETDLEYRHTNGFPEDNYIGSRTTNELKYGMDMTWYDFLGSSSKMFLQVSGRNYFSNTASDYSNFFPFAGLKFDFTDRINSFLWDLFSQDGINQFYIFGNAGKSIHEAPLVYGDPSVISTSLPTSQYNQYFETQAIYAVDKISPEIRKEYSAGLSLNTHYRKLQFDVEYFNNTTDHFVAPVFRNNRFVLENVAKVNNYGWNLSAAYMFNYYYGNTFTIRANWSTYTNKVRQTQSGEYIPLAGFSNISTGMLAGNPLGAIYGTTWLRDDQGRQIIGNDGFPLVNNAISMIGDPNPDWIAGISPLINYDRFSLGFTFSFSKGGEIWNGTAAAMDYTGMSQATAEQRNIKGYLFDGVTGSGQINSTTVDFYDPGQPVQNNRWVRYGMGGVGEEYISDASWIKLSEVSLQYRFDLDSYVFRELVIGLSAHNLLRFSKYKGVDPTTHLFNNASGNGLDLFNLPGTRSFIFSLSMKFGK